MKYGLIGEHLGHSYSREIHRLISGCDYELKELTPDELGAFFENRSFSGINVTIPYKQSVIPYLDEISDTAKSIGAVNTVVNRDGRLYGDNTDFAGMCALLEHAKIDVSGRKVLILGTGGTSKTAKAVMKHLNAAEIITVSRKPQSGTCTYSELKTLHSDAEIIVNTTPVGMFPKDDEAPIDLSDFPLLKGVADVIYNPLRTNLVQSAKSRNIPSEGGLYMLCAQAVYASAVFRNIPVDSSLIDMAYNMVKGEKENVVLIGMPSSGKSCVGKLVAEKTGKTFLDTDELITERAGQKIADYIAENGEEPFRKLEREVISGLSQKSGCVIATGGGAVLSWENVQLLRRNGRLVFLDRSLEKLTPTSDRPLSSDSEKLKKLYETRYPIYRAAADICLEADGTPSEVASDVLKELKQ